MIRASMLLVASATALGLASTAVAQQPAGWYVEGAGGVNWMEDMDFAIEDPGDPDEVFSTEYDTGFAVSGRVGYAFGNGFRVDGEVAYRQNDFDTINIDGESVGSPVYDGDVSSWAFMLNGLYDISTGTSLTPYVGVGVGADFSMNFAKGAALRQASARGGHAAVAPAVFSVLAVCAFLIVHGWEANYGAMDWPALWGGASAVLFAVTASLIAGTAGLALSAPSEQAAVDENNRRAWFTAAWRPLRAALPVTSALAGLAIIGVFAVVALFEIGLSKTVSLFTFLAIIWASAALVFVSLRTSLLIVGLLLASAIFADYAYGLFGAAAPSLLERLSALTLTAIALGQLTVSWRNAGDIWRNARDVAQNAMSDGLRRYLLTFSAGAVALAVAAYGFDWPSGYGAAAYFVSTGALSLLFAPIMMTALSAGTAR